MRPDLSTLTQRCGHPVSAAYPDRWGIAICSDCENWRGGKGGGAIELDSPRNSSPEDEKQSGPRNRRERVANPAHAPYRSKLEAAYAGHLELQKKAGLIEDWRYEPLTLKLSQGKYHRPDFLIWHRDKSIEMAQVKGYHKNLRASLTALKWAAQRNPWFLFTITRYPGHWETRKVKL